MPLPAACGPHEPEGHPAPNGADSDGDEEPLEERKALDPGDPAVLEEMQRHPEARGNEAGNQPDDEGLREDVAPLDLGLLQTGGGLRGTVRRAAPARLAGRLVCAGRHSASKNSQSE